MNKEFNYQPSPDINAMTDEEILTYFPGALSMMSLDIFKKLMTQQITPAVSKMNRQTGQLEVSGEKDT